ncbi:MAG: sarcosine oxidase subunit alpha family protein [Kordiimonadaceae bacterium]|jgi:methylglutamate dehydrogenase subunit C|nr:sarcosine oxidase subunit alpha family protein [Kordiimonadaceae bacterium]MBT6031614.1 sarcosine oxidase subunit alpha family protein [Kordiimonadaceae bacterium]
MSGSRLKYKGLFIDQSKPIEFTFDGKSYSGFEGDTLASAMIANGEMMMARSFKYHRPRGIYSAGPEEPNALVSLRSDGRLEPNCTAPTVELYNGLDAHSQNAWPSLSFDVMAVNQLFSPLLVAGFYYKTFMGTGQRFWHFCEHFIRHAAGMGKASLDPDPDRYEKTNLFADIVIIGSGPAGLAAAMAAAPSGAKILLVDENTHFGGSLPEERGTIDGSDPKTWAAETLKTLSEYDNVTMMSRTTVYGYFDDNTLGAVEKVADHKVVPENFEPRQRHLKIFAKRVIIATGSIERPFVFDGNDTPGVMLAKSALRYANRYGACVGDNVALFTNNDDGYTTAHQLRELGVNVTTVIDARKSINDDLPQDTNIEYKVGHVVTSASGGKALSTMKIAPFDADAKTIGLESTIKVDALLVTAGYTPMINLCSQTGTPAIFDDEIQSFIPGPATRNWQACGAVVGAFTLDEILTTNKVENANKKAIPLALTDMPSSNKSAKKFVDFQHDVSVTDLNIAHTEGFRSVEHLKRYTTLGMAADQGKTSNMNALAIMAELRGISIPEAGTTRFRAPYKPVALGTLAGRDVGKHFSVTRRTPMHDWHMDHGAEMIEAGIWYRPRVYKKTGETVTDAYIREAAAVRNSVGIVDVTSLGKIDVQGPDAAEFLNRIYANAFLKVPIGKARYGIMLREDGYMFDDGTSWRLSETQFLMTTTTANAAGVLSEMERLLTLVWPDLKVHVSSISDQWAGMAVAGPKSRDTLEKVITSVDFSEEGLPFMGVRDGLIDDMPVKVARLSFSGERAYEVYTPTHFGSDVWEAIMKAGEAFDITPYGTEALGTLRIEKGHISGPELDGRTTMADVGLGKMASSKKQYVGSILKERDGLIDDDRQTMVGLISHDDKPLKAGSHLLSGTDNIGHVTSTTYSPALEKFIALALIKNGSTQMGNTLSATFPLKDEQNSVLVVEPHFFDKEGERLYV